MQGLTFIAQLVLLVAYIIGACVVINTLKAQKKSQSELMDKMKQYADIFKVDDFLKYVELKLERERMEQEKRRAIELEEQRKTVEQEINNKAKNGMNTLLKELRELYSLSFRLLSESPDYKTFDSILDRMNNESFSKASLLEARREAKEYWEKLLLDWSKVGPLPPPNILAAVLARMDTNKKP